MLFLSMLESLVYAMNYYITTELLDKADARLFRLVQGPEHSLHHLLTDTSNICSMELNTRGHSFPFLGINITCIKTHQRYFTACVEIRVVIIVWM